MFRTFAHNILCYYFKLSDNQEDIKIQLPYKCFNDGMLQCENKKNDVKNSPVPMGL